MSNFLCCHKNENLRWRPLRQYLRTTKFILRNTILLHLYFSLGLSDLIQSWSEIQPCLIWLYPASPILSLTTLPMFLQHRANYFFLNTSYSLSSVTCPSPFFPPTPLLFHWIFQDPGELACSAYTYSCLLILVFAQVPNIYSSIMLQGNDSELITMQLKQRSIYWIGCIVIVGERHRGTESDFSPIVWSPWTWSHWRRK